MQQRLFLLCIFIASSILLSVFHTEQSYAATITNQANQSAIPLDFATYADNDKPMLERLWHRITISPFNLVASLFFLLAIVHTFLCTRLTNWSHELEHAHDKLKDDGLVPRNSVPSKARLLHFLGEVEVVFGIWVIPLIIAIFSFYDWTTAVDYITHKVNFTEAMFVVVIMTLSSTRPILKLAEIVMEKLANLFGGSLTAWWITILTFGPILGSFVTEPAAMTISALLLNRKFFALEPSTRFKYATLGLLFVNISVGGTLTHFAAPPVLMVAEPWGWNSWHMMTHFGWKAIIGILIANATYWVLFRSEFARLRDTFQLRNLKESILRDHLDRQKMEREIDGVIDELSKEVGFRENLASLIESFLDKVEKRLEKEWMKSLMAGGIDPELAQRAFEERFEEIKLYRIQREFPNLLNKQQRAPFRDPNWNQREDPVPAWLMGVHALFMGWTIVNAHYPALFVAGLLFFLGFAIVTADQQNTVDLKPPLLVGFFLGGLVVHGGLQGWWIEPVLSGLSAAPLMLVATTLTAFNDNAAITYLSTLVPSFTEELKYAVVAGAVAGGGLTVIANAPNPAGQALVRRYFDDGVSPLGLLKAALIPTAIMLLVFLVLG